MRMGEIKKKGSNNIGRELSSGECYWRIILEDLRGEATETGRKEIKKEQSERDI